MTIDGYSAEEQMKECLHQQDVLNDRLADMVSDLNELPNRPHSLEEWIEGWSGKNKFDLSTAKKHSEYRKSYIKLMDEAAENMQKMRMAKINVLMEKIEKALDGTSSSSK